jgi:hypothetical protein
MGRRRETDSLAGVRGLELRYPDTSHIFEMSMITVVGSAETRQQRLFAFELRRWGTRSSGLLPGSSRPMLCAGPICQSDELALKKTGMRLGQVLVLATADGLTSVAGRSDRRAQPAPQRSKQR